MRITTYTTRIKDNLNVLVKERAFNYKTENSHLDSAEKIAKMMCLNCIFWQKNMFIF